MVFALSWHSCVPSSISVQRPSFGLLESKSCPSPDVCLMPSNCRASSDIPLQSGSLISSSGHLGESAAVGGAGAGEAAGADACSGSGLEEKSHRSGSLLRGSCCCHDSALVPDWWRLAPHPSFIT